MCLIFTEITLNNKKLILVDETKIAEEEKEYLERKEQEDVYEYQKRLKLYQHRKTVEETNRQRLLHQYQQINEEFDNTLQFILNSLTVLCSHVNIHQNKNSLTTIGSCKYIKLLIMLKLYKNKNKLLTFFFFFIY